MEEDEEGDSDDADCNQVKEISSSHDIEPSDSSKTMPQTPQNF
jgi:hypothetical protein